MRSLQDPPNIFSCAAPDFGSQEESIREEERMSDFHNLIEREIPRLRRYARALTRSVDRADDLVQETLLRAVAKAHLWQAGTDIRAWLFTIMHNQYVNMVRRASRERATVDIEQMSSALVATTDPTASRQLRELERALGRLPGQHGHKPGVFRGTGGSNPVPSSAPEIGDDLQRLRQPDRFVSSLFLFVVRF